MNDLPKPVKEAFFYWTPIILTLIGAWFLVHQYGKKPDHPIPLYIVPVDDTDDGVEYILLTREGIESHCERRSTR